MDLSDHPSAVLTPRQREFLLGEADLSDRGERASRARIRERLRTSIFDLQLIVSTLSLRDIDEALTEPADYEPEPGTIPPILNSLPALPAIVYLFYRRGESEVENQPDGWLTANAVESGIKTALSRMGIGYDQIEVSIHVERAEDLETLADRDLAELSRDQLTQLHQVGLIDSEGFVDAWREKEEKAE